MWTDGSNETDVRKRHAAMAAVDQRLSALPFLAMGAVFRDILANVDRLPDAELMRVAGCLRTLADQVMATVDQRCGSRPAPRLVVDNTRRD
jgi:predicted pyridoxine 5'-phosphate oxidase superfamily flavin-nucleotide-binding protein